MDNKLELHYFLDGNLHSMDAIIKNKAEFELLRIFNEVASILKIELDYEIEALAEGGLIERFKLKKKTKKQLKLYVLYPTIVGSVIGSIAFGLNYIANYEREELEKEKLRLEIRKLNKEDSKDNIAEEQVHKIVDTIFSSNKLMSYKSNYFTNLVNEGNVNKVSVREVDQDNKPVSDEFTIERDKFDDQIIKKKDLEGLHYEDVDIEIISPVLTYSKSKNKIKWRGIFNGEKINFNLNDADFTAQVLNKEFSFSNGTFINGDISFKRELDENGEIKITNINVDNVNNVFEGDSITPVKKKTKKNIANQLTIF